MVSCLLLAHGFWHPLAPTPVVGRVGHVWRTTPDHMRAEEVARPWTGRPGNRAIQDLAVRQARQQARIDQTRQARLTPATPSEQPDDSVRVLRSDQILADHIWPNARQIGASSAVKQSTARANTQDWRICQSTLRPNDQHSEASAASRNIVGTQCAPCVKPKASAASRATACTTAITLPE
jgi:hypothetical protein